MTDRQELNHALAKALAFKACGKHQAAALWAARLVSLLACAEILDAEAVDANARAVGGAWGELT
jgi:hypothetical protein